MYNNKYEVDDLIDQLLEARKSATKNHDQPVLL